MVVESTYFLLRFALSVPYFTILSGVFLGTCHIFLPRFLFLLSSWLLLESSVTYIRSFLQYHSHRGLSLSTAITHRTSRELEDFKFRPILWIRKPRAHSTTLYNTLLGSGMNQDSILALMNVSVVFFLETLKCFFSSETPSVISIVFNIATNRGYSHEHH